MLKSLFRNAANRQVIGVIHGKIVAAARQPALYADYGVPDTLEGRFELVTLHAMLVLRVLRHAPQPGPHLAQDVSNAVFAGFDADLREMGVGDVILPKRINRLVEAFIGRCAAYEAALGDPNDSPLEIALNRNIYAPRSGDASRLARYARACAAQLARLAPDKPASESINFAAAADIA